MGLEIVEVIMRTEETFGIEIPDEDATKFDTVGNIYQYVLKALDTKRPNRQNEGWDDSEVWRMLRELIADQTSLPIERIVPEAHMVRDLDLD